MMLRIKYLLVLLILGTNSASAKDIKAYIFGNSLVHHLTESDETTVPHWLGFLARSAGHEFAVDGQWGFLRNFSEDLPPTSNWSFKQVSGVWNSDRGDFGKAGFDIVMINSANFIQDRAPDKPTAWKNPTGRTPLDDTLVVFDWVSNTGATPVFYVYQGWPEMPGLIENNKPAEDFAEYYDHAQNDYYQWYVDWVAAISKARPNYDVRLIPVAKNLATLFTETALSKIPPADLYSDDDPHGTATLYFLAAAITYSAYFDEPIPTNLKLPASIHPLVEQNLDVINKVISGAEIAAKPDLQTGPVKQAAVTDGLGLGNPSLAMGLNGIADWSTQNPFVDVMKTARPWVGHMPDKWGAKTAEDLMKDGHLDAAGWPIRMPDGLTAIETFVLTDQPKEGASVGGVYRLTYEGEGKVTIGGRGRLMHTKSGEMWFRFQPGEGPVGIGITATDPEKTGNYIRNIRIVHEDNIELFEVGALFNPGWLKVVEDLRVVRFMDWMDTNGSTQTNWAGRPKLDDYTYGRRGVPVEVMVMLANQIGADPWFTMPHMADDDYMRQFAAYVKDKLSFGLHAYVEYSNELWNFTFGQTHWAAQQAEKRWGKDAAPDAWLQFAGVRAAEMAQIWSEIFGDQAEQRLVRVIATHTGWIGLEEGLMAAPLYLAEDTKNLEPITWFDAYAVTGYFGLELGMDEMAPKVLEWIAASRLKAEKAGTAKGLARVSLREYVKEHGFVEAVPLAAKAIRKGSLAELLTELIPYHANIAQQNGLQLVMYEGGTHVAGLAGWSNNEDLTAFFNHLNYSPEMAKIYQELLQGWRSAGGSLFNAFVDVSAPSQYGSWGTLRHLDDQNVRYDVLANDNRNTAGWWEERGLDTFTHGGRYFGTGATDEMRGTGKADIMIGRDGDDRLYAKGQGDLIHGGAGQDTIIFPGDIADYSIENKAGIIFVQNAAVSAQAYAVEHLVFDSNPDNPVLVSDY
jgi:hypothetical protein